MAEVCVLGVLLVSLYFNSLFGVLLFGTIMLAYTKKLKRWCSLYTGVTLIVVVLNLSWLWGLSLIYLSGLTLPFIVHVSSLTVHSGSVPLCLVEWGNMSLTPHLHNLLGVKPLETSKRWKTSKAAVVELKWRLMQHLQALCLASRFQKHVTLGCY